MFSSPMGYLYFYSKKWDMLQITKWSSRPLWGIYISIRKRHFIVHKIAVGSRPLWGIYISIHNILLYHLIPLRSRPLWGIYISIPEWLPQCSPKTEFSSPMGYLYFYSLSSLSLICKELILYFAVQNIFLDLSDLFY